MSDFHVTAREWSEPAPVDRRWPSGTLLRAKLALALLVGVILIGSLVSAPLEPIVRRESTR